MEDATILIGESEYEEAIEILSETNWDGMQLKELNLSKERMYGFFGMVPPPKVAAAKP
jgi:phage pi2 protein 07